MRKIIEIKEEVQIGDIILEKGDNIKMLKEEVKNKEKIEESNSLWPVYQNKVVNIISNSFTRELTSVSPDQYSINSWKESLPTVSGNIFIVDNFSMRISFDFDISFYDLTNENIGNVKGTFILITKYSERKGEAITEYILSGIAEDDVIGRKSKLSDKGIY